jgi:hypothetical protein
VNISKRQITERIPFETKIDPQILFAGVPKADLPGYGQQNGPMRNDQEPNAYRKADQNAPQNVPVSSFLGLIALSHRTTLLPAMSQSKAQLGGNPAIRH